MNRVAQAGLPVAFALSGLLLLLTSVVVESASALGAAALITTLLLAAVADPPTRSRDPRRRGFGRVGAAIAALLLKAQVEDPNVLLSAALHAASSAILGRPLEYTEADLQKVMSPAHFVSVRKTYGGPAPEETTRAIGVSRRLLDADRETWTLRRESRGRAEANLKARVTQL